jgi:Ran GTPase-activating protein (RanGAP) involved in mRNA processing and transport
VMSSLTRVSLANTKLGEEGTKVICDALKDNTTVKELDLSGDATAHPADPGTVIETWTCVDPVGVAYRNSPSMEDRSSYSINSGSRITAIDRVGVDGNWLQVVHESGTKYLPIMKDGNVLFEKTSVNVGVGVGKRVDLSNIGGPLGAKHVADLLRSMGGSLTECNVSDNNLDIESAQMLAKIGTEKRIALFGIKRDQKVADFQNKGLGPVDAILIASDLVHGGLTELNLDNNALGDSGIAAICQAVQSDEQSKLATLIISSNRVGPVGANSVAAMVAAHLVLKRVDVRSNSFTGDAASQLSAAVVGNLNIEMFNEIPIKDMRADSIIELDLEEKKIGVEGIMVVAGLIPVMSSLTRVSLANTKLGEEGTKVICDALKDNTTVKELDLSGDANFGGLGGSKHVVDLLKSNGVLLTECNVRGNKFDIKSAKILAKISTEKGIMLFGVKRDQKEADLQAQGLGPADGILIASDLVNGLSSSLTLIGEGGLDLRGNSLGDEGWGAIIRAVCSSPSSKISSIDASGQGIGSAGAKLIAEALRTCVNGALTVLRLGDNPLGPEGCKALSDVLKVNTCLKELVLLPLLHEGCRTTALPAPAGVSLGSPNSAIKAAISAAIHIGAPVYNEGNHDGCYYMYRRTAEELCVRLKSESVADQRRALGDGLDKAHAVRMGIVAEGSHRYANGAAWAMRRCLDAVLKLADAVVDNMPSAGEDSPPIAMDPLILPPGSLMFVTVCALRTRLQTPFIVSPVFRSFTSLKRQPSTKSSQSSSKRSV